MNLSETRFIYNPWFANPDSFFFVFVVICTDELIVCKTAESNLLSNIYSLVTKNASVRWIIEWGFSPLNECIDWGILKLSVQNGAYLN